MSSYPKEVYWAGLSEEKFEWLLYQLDGERMLVVCEDCLNPGDDD